MLIREVGSDDDIRVTDDQLCHIIQTHHVYLYVCGVQSVVNGERGVNSLLRDIKEFDIKFMNI